MGAIHKYRRSHLKFPCILHLCFKRRTKLSPCITLSHLYFGVLPVSCITLSHLYFGVLPVSCITLSHLYFGVLPVSCISLSHLYFGVLPVPQVVRPWLGTSPVFLINSPYIFMVFEYIYSTSGNNRPIYEEAFSFLRVYFAIYI